MVHDHMREVTASAFKAGCLAMLDEVAVRGESLLITNWGRPVARVEPVEEPPSLIGSVSFKVSTRS
jgi:antitoxin (DNA-binding transcriptional repressor) of toxin-antitoxin stability system